MLNDNLEFFILNQFDPLGNRVGGIGKYILSLIEHLPENIKITLVCVTSDKCKLFNKELYKISGRNVWLLPIVHVSNENIRTLIPLSLKYTLALRKIPNLPKVCFLIQRPEYFLSLKINNDSKYISFIHTDLERSLDASISESKWSYIPFFYKKILKFCLNRADKILSVSTKSIIFLSNCCQIEKTKIFFSPTWPNQSLFRYPSKNSKGNKINQVENWSSKFETTLIFVGRFQKVKNIPLLLDILRILPRSFCLIMVGDGDLYKDIVKEVSRDELINSRVYFTGAVEQAFVAELLGISNMYISVSNYEGMSVALLEALSCGVPVVTTPTGESALIVQNYVNGLMLNGWSAKAIAQSILDLQQHLPLPQDCVNSIKKFKPAVTVENIMELING